MPNFAICILYNGVREVRLCALRKKIFEEGHGQLMTTLTTINSLMNMDMGGKWEEVLRHNDISVSSSLF